MEFTYRMSKGFRFVLLHGGPLWIVTILFFQGHKRNGFFKPIDGDIQFESCLIKCATAKVFSLFTLLTGTFVSLALSSQ